ncbi:MAG: RNA polymerase factor sigma-32 [Gammaproteobacteria bacterium 39-13]|nr:RNA polymerase sigma factor RpoH [Gammaproteobacteria bacterium]OJV89963.1 MAG: RNA polymerase factor sigma-32 [Gammaproteobacteria bacterium 39-13]
MNTKALQTIPNTLPVAADGLQAYLQRVNAIPLLSAEEEFELAKRFQEKGELYAAQRLVLSHLRYVVRVARMYSGYGLALADLIQEGTIGLMKAVKRFDPTKEVRLVSFAVHWIKSEIHEFVIRNWRIVKVATTKAQRKLFFNLRQAKQRLGWFSAEEVQAVAKDLGVSAADVMEMETRLNARDDSFDHFATHDDDNTSLSAAHYLPAPVESDPAVVITHNNWEDSAQSNLQTALQKLDARSLDIVSKRWLGDEKTSLKDLAEKYQVSLERIRQLEKAAIDKLRQNMLAQDQDIIEASSF